MEKYLVVLEQKGENLSAVSLRLCQNIIRFTAPAGAEVAAVLFGSCHHPALKEMGLNGVSKVYLASQKNGLLYSTEQRVNILKGIAANYQPSYILLPDTVPGRETAPSLALTLKAGLVSHCVQIHSAGGRAEAVLAVYNNQYQMHCELSNKLNVAVMADVNCGDLLPVNTGEVETIVVAEPEDTGQEPKVLETFQVPSVDRDIDEADLVMGIGRGVNTTEDYRLVEELALALGAPVGGTRPAADGGWIPIDRQIGQSGRVISPGTYLAIGVSGAQQHISGVNRGRIVAINSDPHAPIFRVAELGIVGDFKEIVLLLLQKLRENVGEG